MRILPHHKYTKAISWDILITIACSFGVSKALQNSGAADAIATQQSILLEAGGPWGF
jgi:di/tricarboxylate transporter